MVSSIGVDINVPVYVSQMNHYCKYAVLHMWAYIYVGG